MTYLEPETCFTSKKQVGILMSAWLCPVKFRSWRIIRRRGVFGVPERARAILEQLNIGDYMVFHVYRGGMVAICKVTSGTYKDNEDIWGKDLYPFRVKIEIIHDLLAEKKNPIPISCILGSNLSEEFTIEPYLRNVRIAKIGQNQFDRLLGLFQIESERTC